jgi:hypothetical protein
MLFPLNTAIRKGVQKETKCEIYEVFLHVLARFQEHVRQEILAKVSNKL